MAVILGVGLGLRLLYLRELLDKPDFTVPAVDAGFHDYWARALATGNWRPPFGFPDPEIRRTAYLRPPGYPYFLSLIYTVCGSGYTAPRVVQMGLGLVSAALAWAATRRWFGPAVSLTLAGLMATYWIFIYFEGEFHSGVLVIYLSWLIVYFAGAWAERAHVRHALIVGVLVGVTGLVLPNALVFLPVLLAWTWWITRRPEERGRFWPAAATMVAGAAAAVAPATIRNYVVSRDFVLISNNAGINLFIGNNEAATGLVADRIADLGDFKTCFDYPALLANLEHKLGKTLKPSEVSRHFTGEALRFIREHPARFVELTALKTWLFWGPREVLHNKVIRYEREASTVLRLIPVNFAIVVSLAVVGILGIVRYPRAAVLNSTLSLSPSRSLTLLFLGLILAHFFSVLPFFAAARYRVPIIPFLLFFAACGVCRIAQWAARREWSRATGWAAIAAACYGVLVSTRALTPEGDFELAKWYYDRAVAYSLAGRNEPAVAEYREVLLRMPQNSPARLGLGLCLGKLGRTDEAIEQFREAIRLSPAFPEAHYNLAVALYARGERDQAIEHCVEAIGQNPGFAEAHYSLGVILAASRREAEAMSHYSEAIRLRPEFAPAHLNLAVAYFAHGRFADAERHFRAVTQLDPFNPEARCNLALALSQQGRVAEAAAEYQAALRIDPGYAAAIAGLAELKTLP